MQPAHALAEFAIQYPVEFKDWQINHKNLVVVAAKDECSLKELGHRFATQGIKFTQFTEPDINDEVTAIAVEPSFEAYKLTSNLPLALKV